MLTVGLVCFFAGCLAGSISLAIVIGGTWDDYES